MFQKKTLAPIVILITLSFIMAIFTGCGAQGTNTGTNTATNTTTTEKYTIRLGSVVAEDHYLAQWAINFGKLASEKTNGQVEFQYSWSSALGSDRDMIEQMKMGALEMKQDTLATWSSFLPETALLNLPYLIKDYKHVEKVYDGPLGEQMKEKMIQDQGIRVLAWGRHAFRQVFTTKKEINTLADMNGLKIRTPEIPAWMDTFTALGAKPTPTPYGEVYTALQTGVVDGFENDWYSTVVAKHYEVVGYGSEIAHSYLEGMLIIDEKFYQKLPVDIQKALQEAANEATKINNANVIAEQEKAVKFLEEKGLTFTHPNLDEFRKAADSVQKKYAAELKAEAFLEEVVKLGE